jgi:hypothetical protein
MSCLPPGELAWFWRRRRFPCLVWRQIRGELLGHLTITYPIRGVTPPRNTPKRR